MFRLLNNRNTFKEVENGENNICWRILFSVIAHLQKAPITADSENIPISQSSASMRKYHHLFKQTFWVLIKIHVIECNLWFKTIQPRKEFTRFAWSKPLQKCWTAEFLAATSLTTYQSPSKKRKIHQIFKKSQFFFVIKFLGYSNICVY